MPFQLRYVIQGKNNVNGTLEVNPQDKISEIITKLNNAHHFNPLQKGTIEFQNGSFRISVNVRSSLLDLQINDTYHMIYTPEPAVEDMLGPNSVYEKQLLDVDALEKKKVRTLEDDAFKKYLQQQNADFKSEYPEANDTRWYPLKRMRDAVASVREFYNAPNKINVLNEKRKAITLKNAKTALQSAWTNASFKNLKNTVQFKNTREGYARHLHDKRLEMLVHHDMYLSDAEIKERLARFKRHKNRTSIQRMLHNMRPLGTGGRRTRRR